MSQPDLTDSSRGVYVQKPKSDVYTVMLAISLVALIIAIVCLVLENQAYEWDFKANSARGVGSVAPLEVPLRSEVVSADEVQQRSVHSYPWQTPRGAVSLPSAGAQAHDGGRVLA